MALTTLTEIKTFLGVTTTARDARYDALRAAAEVLVKRYCKRDLESATYTEYYAGRNDRTIALRQFPVTEVISAALATRGSWGQATDSYTALVQGTDYAVAYTTGTTAGSGLLVRLTGPWPEHPVYGKAGVLSREAEPGLGNVKVVYTAGYVTVPEDLKLAVAQVAAFTYRTSSRGGADYSERLGDHSYMIPMERIRSSPDLGETRQILAYYRDNPW